MIKKFSYAVLMVVFVIPMFVSPVNVKANGKTLRDLYNNLSKLEKELDEINSDKSMTENRINQIKGNIQSIDKEVIDIERTVENIHTEIKQLNDDIIAKDKETKEFVKYYQLSTGENMYLEYAFGAKSMADFIKRLATAEQFINHNNKLIDDMNELITSQEKKSKELAVHQQNIIVKRKELSEEQFKLGDRIVTLYKNTQSVSQEISDAKKAIKNYENLGCRPNDLLSECIKVNGDKSFARPTLRGRVTCGWFCYPEHRAVDIGGYIHGENIYPVANGRVVDITWGSSCGGNYVTIQHNINGKPYASRYMHMLKIYVSFNQVVSKDTVIGTVGGAPGGVDKCTDGSHLHLAIAQGTYLQDFWSFAARAVNPRNLINFPAGNGWYYNRYERY